MRYFTWQQLLAITNGTWDRFDYLKTTGFKNLVEGAAGAKDPNVMFEIGVLSLIGDTRITADAVGWLQAASDRDHGGAYCVLGYMSEYGVLRAQDVQDALSYYEKSALLENAAAQYRLAYHFRKNGAEKNFGFLRWCQKSAGNGDSDGQYLLGTSLRDGFAVDRNLSEALRWFTKSAEAGNTDAMRALASMYEEGRGTEASYKKADYWFELAGGKYDIEVKHSISLLDAFRGLATIVSYDDGIGKKEISIEIARGIETGAELRVKNAGRLKRDGSSRGDLFVTVDVLDDRWFKREGANLYARLRIPERIAASGGRAEVPLLDGRRVSLSIPPSTQNGLRLRLKSKGMPQIDSDSVGDLFITVSVEIPQSTEQGADCLLVENEAWKQTHHSGAGVSEPSDEANLEEDELKLMKALKSLIMRDDAILQTIAYYSAKYPKFTRIEILEVILEDYERDRS